MPASLATMAYIIATILFIFSLSGLNHQETARRGNSFGILGMAIAILAATLSNSVDSYSILIITMVIGGAIGARAAIKVKMTQMPELVAIMHSLVGLAAVLVGFANYMGTSKLKGIEKSIHETEIYIGIFIGAITFSGSVIAFGKLSERISGKPILLHGRHWLNLAMILASIIFCYLFLRNSENSNGLYILLIMTAIALALGVHMVMAIGGADMPVVVSMLNSYSGWAASATGFMLENDALIVTGALVGSSGAILSYIMCRAMNRNFISVIAGGFGSGTGGEAAIVEGNVQPISAEETAKLLMNAKNIMIIPGYGMAVAHAQHTVNEITKLLRNKGKKVGFGVHPVAGRMPGHINVLLAEAKVPYDIVYEMDEINEDWSEVDVSIVIGANDIVNPSAMNDPHSPIAGMPVLKCWEAKTTIVLKRSMASGYAGVGNPLFVLKNTHMLFGDANVTMSAVLKTLQQ